MAFCLVGLTWIQVKLVRKAMKSAEEEWDTQARNLVVRVTDQIEEQEIMMLLSAFLESQSVGLFRNQMGGLGANIDYDSMDVQLETNEQQIRFFTGPVPASMPDTTGRTINLKDNPDVSMSFNDGKINMNPALTRTLVNRFNIVYDLDTRAHSMNIDSLLKEALSQQDIELAYQFWVTDLTGNLVMGDSLNEEADKAGLYKSTLFSGGNLKGENGMLWLYFPGRERHIYASSALTLGMSGLFILVIILIFWITLRNLMKQKRLSEVKTDFINQMTHEFKTPIATITLAADSLNNSKVNSNPEQIAMYSQIIKEESRRMNRQVESVLEVAQLNRDEIGLQIDRLDMRRLIKNAIETVKLALKEKDGSISFEPGNHPVFVSGEGKYLEGVVVNLLDNAIKYCEKAPLIDIELAQQDDKVKLSVADNGIGISSQYHGKIFEKFYRIPSENSEYISGSGLGLSYVQSVLTLHHAQISVEERPEGGSVFTISLPQMYE